MSKEIEFRELNAGDIFLVSAVLDKVDLDLESIDSENKTKAGMTFMYQIIRKIHKAKDEVNELLASLTGLEKEEVEKISVIKYSKMIKKLAGNKELIELFKLAGQE